MMDKFDRMSAYGYGILRCFDFNLLKKYPNLVEIIT